MKPNEMIHLLEDKNKNKNMNKNKNKKRIKNIFYCTITTTIKNISNC